MCHWLLIHGQHSCMQMLSGMIRCIKELVNLETQDFLVVQSLSCVQLLATLWTITCQSPLSSSVSQSLLKLMSIELLLSNHLLLCQPLLLLHSLFPSIKVFSSELAPLIRQPKYWTFSSSPSNEYSGLISLGLTGLILLQSKGLLRAMPQTVFSVHGILQTRILKWVAFPSLWDLPDPGIELTFSALGYRFFSSEPPGKTLIILVSSKGHTYL